MSFYDEGYSKTFTDFSKDDQTTLPRLADISNFQNLYTNNFKTTYPCYFYQDKNYGYHQTTNNEDSTTAKNPSLAFQEDNALPIQMSSNLISSTVPPHSPPTSSNQQTTTRSRRPKKLVPEKEKDEEYRKRRKRNNEAAKRSRDIKRKREEENEIKLMKLNQELEMMNTQILQAENRILNLKSILDNNPLTSHFSHQPNNPCLNKNFF